MKKIPGIYFVIAAVIGALLIANGVTVWLLMNQDRSAIVNSVNQEPFTNTPAEMPNGNINTDSDNTDTSIPQPKQFAAVSWTPFPAETSTYRFFDYTDVSEKLKDDELVAQRWQNGIGGFLNDLKIYRVGTITDGVYAGKEVFIITASVEGPAFRRNFFRVVKVDNNTFVHLAAYSDPLTYSHELSQLMTTDRDTGLTGLETPPTLSIPNSAIQLKRVPSEPYKLITEYERLTKVFTVNGIEVYKDEINNCFVVKAADGTAREYYFDVPAFGTRVIENTYFGSYPSKIDVTYSDGSTNQREYNFQYVGGCGARGCYRYAPYITSVNMLKQVGTFANGNPVYELTDTRVKATPESEKSVLEEMYDQYYPGYDETTNQQKPKKPFATFVTERPILYWQDPFGKFIEFRSAEYLPAVECGKPVIYLYPEKTTDVSVWVNPAGGFSVTDPVYNDGWFIRATPQSDLFNYADGKTYPYLFWEGFGYNYVRPNVGAVVAKKDVAQYLTTTLAKLGMNKRESADFMEFWAPRMQEKPYYFITFLPQQEFDKVAPLTVSPRPDTVIRVFMDYEGLDEKKYVEPQRIVTPVRVGFTVVEWGGALHR